MWRSGRCGDGRGREGATPRDGDGFVSRRSARACGGGGAAVGDGGESRRETGAAGARTDGEATADGGDETRGHGGPPFAAATGPILAGRRGESSGKFGTRD